MQQQTLGHRGRKSNPLYGVRRTLHTGEALLTQKQQARLDAVFAVERQAEVKATWQTYQQMITAYRNPDRAAGRAALAGLIAKGTQAMDKSLVELRKLVGTLKRRSGDILAYFDHPRTSNGPTEAMNGRLEHLRGSALGFRNLANYVARSLLETGGFRPLLHSGL